MDRKWGETGQMNENVLKNVWPEWQVEKQLGRGSYGTVYQAVRRDRGLESRAAIKVISIPSDESELDSLRSEGLDMRASRTYLQQIVDDFVKEIELMESLKGIQNIVSVEDYKVLEKTGEVGWFILIRMELLIPFNEYVRDRSFTERDVVKLGCDICTALDFCGKRSIIHRDIKPENIFVNDFGDFKLGDFGIARRLENLTGALSQKGTLNYMAPEVMKCSEYDSRADIYSLGIMLYRLLNGNRMPFLETDEQLKSPSAREQALDRRMRGERLPPPCNASPEMAEIILRACAYDPKDRFGTAAEMRQAFQTMEDKTVSISDMGKVASSDSVSAIGRGGSNSPSISAPDPKGNGADIGGMGKTSQCKSRVSIALAAVLAVVAIVVASVFMTVKLLGNRTAGSVASQDTPAPSELPVPTDTPVPTAALPPTDTPAPTNVPTITPAPAETAVPTAVPVMTDTPVPSDTLFAAEASVPSVGRYTYLYELPYSDLKDEPFIYYDIVTDSYGTSYNNGIGGSAARSNDSVPVAEGQSWQEYEMDGTYSQLRGRIVLNYDARTQVNADVYVWVYGDGVLLYRSPAMTAGFKPCDVSLDISDIKTLKVVVQGRNMVRLVDWALYEDADLPTVSSAVEAPKNTRQQIPLAELDWFSGSIHNGAFVLYDHVTDTLGNTYTGGLGGKKEDGTSWQEYWLDGRYAEISGAVAAAREAAVPSGSEALFLYGDGALLYQSQPLAAGSQSQEFSVDLSGVQVLRVAIEGKNALRLVDCVLKR